MPKPIYTPDNCSDPAYQLDWSYSAFRHAGPPDSSWLDELNRLNAPDHIRILQHEFRGPNRSQFLISTRPSVKPLVLVQCVKGRLQHLLHGSTSKPFRRNYSLRSIGSTRWEELEQYLIDLILGCDLEESPEQVVLGYMNNLAYACGMKPVFRSSYYVGTLSEYDLGVIPRG